MTWTDPLIASPSLPVEYISKNSPTYDEESATIHAGGIGRERLNKVKSKVSVG